MTAPVNFVRNVGKIFASKIVIIFLKLGIGVLTARAFGVTGKGLFVLAQQIPGFFTMFTNLSLGEALTVLISQGKIKKHEICATVLLLVFGIASISMATYYTFLPYFAPRMFGEGVGSIPLWSGLMIPIVVVEYFALFAIRGAKQYNLYLWLSLSAKTSTLIALLLACLYFEATTETGIKVYILINLTFSLIFLAATFFVSQRRLCLRKENIRSSLHYGATIHPSTLLTDLEYRFDVYLLAFFMAPAAIGIYSVAVTLAQLSWYLTNSVTTIFLPELGSSDAENHVRHTEAVTRNTVFATFIANAGLAIGGFPLLWVLYGAEFSDSYFVMLLLLPGILLDSSYRVLSGFYKNKFDNLYLNKLAGLSLIVNVALNIMLIPLWGIFGAALSSAITYMLKALLMIQRFAREEKSSFRAVCLPTANDIQLYRKFALKLTAKLNPF